LESEGPNIEEIEKYLSGQMNAFDAGLFEVRLSNDEALRELAESLRMAIEVAKQYRAHELKLFIEKNAPKVYKNTFWQTTIIYSVAASLVLLSVSYGLLIYFDKDQKQMAQGLEKTQSAKHEKGKSAYIENETIKEGTDSVTGSGIGVKNMELATLQDSLKYAYNIKEEDMKMPAEESITLLSKDIAAGATTADDFKVQTDELVLDTNYTTYLAMEVANLEKKALKKKSIILPQSNNNRNNQAPASRQNDNNNNESDKTVEYKASPQMLNVEFWKSPVNYKGYRYNTKKLIIYGMKPADITLIKVKGVLYIKSAGQYYKIEENDRFNNFWAEAVAPVEE